MNAPFLFRGNPFSASFFVLWAMGSALPSATAHANAGANEPRVGDVGTGERPLARCVPVLIGRDGALAVDHGSELLRCVIVDPRANDNALRAARSNLREPSLLAVPASDDTDALAQPLDEAAPNDDWLVHEELDLPFDLQSLEGMGSVVRWVRFYATEGRRRMNSYLARAGRYRALIEEELRNQGAPLDLLWVVAIESNFDPVVGSSAGAQGLWQFMPRTARSRGLRVDRELDERLDVERATTEAIAYLLMQKERFGSWPLALAAYNAGSGHVRSSIREHGVTELDAMARYGAVYQDARAYAAKIVAIALIARNLEYFGFHGVIADAPVEWESVRIEGKVRLSLIADAAGVSAKEVIDLNPALLARSTPEGGHDVRIPVGSFERFVRDYDRVASRYGTAHTEVTLRFGETPAMIARQEGIPERVLRAVNGFGASERVPYGATLVVPESSRRSAGTPSTAEAPVIVVAEQEFAYPERQRIFYQAHAHDTLREISEFFGVSPFQLAAWNELDPSATIWAGMILQLWVSDDFDESRAVFLREGEVNVLRMGTPEWSAWRSQEQADRRESAAPRRSHRVRPGDTVLRIANRYGVEASDIVRWNRLRSAEHIVIGQDLWVAPR